MADSTPDGRAPIEPERTFHKLWTANFWEFRVAGNWARRVLRVGGKADASHRGGLTRLGQVVIAILALLVIRILVALVLAVIGVLLGVEPQSNGSIRMAPANRSVSPDAAKLELWMWLIGTGFVIAVGVWMGIRRTRAERVAQTKEAA